MWPFDRKDRTLRKTFGKYVKPEEIEKLLKNSPAMEELQKKHLNFILVMVDTIIAQDGTVDLLGSMVMGFFGFLEKQPNSREIRVQTVKNLEEELESTITVVHGEADCLVGIIGSENRFHFTALLPDFKEKIRILSALKGGETKEL